MSTPESTPIYSYLPWTTQGESRPKPYASSQSRLYPPIRDFGFGPWSFINHSMLSGNNRPLYFYFRSNPKLTVLMYFLTPGCEKASCSYDGEKGWSLIYHTIFSGNNRLLYFYFQAHNDSVLSDPQAARRRAVRLHCGA